MFLQIDLVVPQRVFYVTFYFRADADYLLWTGRNRFIEIRVGDVDAAVDHYANPIAGNLEDKAGTDTIVDVSYVRIQHSHSHRTDVLKWNKKWPFFGNPFVFHFKGNKSNAFPYFFA